MYSTIRQLVNSKGFVTLGKLIKATFIFLNVLQVVIKERIPVSEKITFVESLVSYIKKCKNIKTRNIQWDTVRLYLQTTISDSLFPTELEKRNKYRPHNFSAVATECKSAIITFVCVFSTLQEQFTLRLQLLIVSQEIIVLLHNRRISHSEQPSTFSSILLMQDKDLLGRIV